MEAVIFRDSPLAEYLEGEGEAGSKRTSAEGSPHLSPTSSPRESFAPRGFPTTRRRPRNTNLRQLRLSIPRPDTIDRIQKACSRAVNARLGRAENARFLEQFRYIIVASQLLNADVNTSQYNAPSDVQRVSAEFPAQLTSQASPISLTGAALTGAGAFILAWLLYWARGGNEARTSIGRIAIVVSLLLVAATLLYASVRRSWLLYFRQNAVDCATRYVEKSQTFDAAAMAAITLIQEVELVSRGYRISTPLPPVSRLEERSQTRRCSRLRRILHTCLSSILNSYVDGCGALRPLAEEVDLDKYFDIYDISTTDVQYSTTPYVETEVEEAELLKSLKALLHRTYMVRKIFLCCLLALEATGGKPDFARWGTAVHCIENASAVVEDGAEKIRRILSEEEHFPTPQTPKFPTTPAKEKVRVQLRKLGSLSHGIRSLQAKMHLLREESDRSLDEAEEVGELGSNLMAQYESIGSDLRMLMEEWESGKAALASNIDKNEKRLSIASGGLRSPTVSLGGMTAVDGSPTDALRALNGDDKSRSSLDSTNSDDEVFEAVAVPRQRSTLNRDERLAKMREDRVKVFAAREKAQANTHMIRELESVINLRPRGRTTSNRITSV